MRPLLRPQGRYVAIGPSPNPIDFLRAALDVPVQFLGLPGIQREGYDFFLLSPSRTRVRQLGSWYEKGLLPSVAIDSTVIVDSDAKIQEAMDRMESRRTVGKIVLKVQSGA